MAPENLHEMHAVWVTAGLGCDGDTIAMTAATQPNLEEPFLVLSKLLTPMWKDSILLESSDEGVHLRTQYERFTGDFVMHCHILVHEDVGMMQRVRIVEPGDHEES